MGKRRKKGEGSVRQRKDGRWEGRVVVGYDEKGLPKTKNVLAKTKRECQEKLKQLRETVTGSKTEKVRPEMLFGEWLDFWYQNYVKPQIRPTTQANYEAKIYQHIIPELGKISLNQLAQKDLQQFYARMKTGGRLIRTEQFGRGLSDSMVRGLHAACRSALEKAVQEELIRTNPAVAASCRPSGAGRCRCWAGRSSSGFLFRPRRRDTLSCSFWTYVPACGGANCWPSSGTTWTSRPGP